MAIALGTYKSSYYIKPSQVTLMANDQNNPSLVYVGVRSGTYVEIYYTDRTGATPEQVIGYGPNSSYQKWQLSGSSTKLASNAKHYIYIRLRRTEKTAMLIFSTRLYDFYGENPDGVNHAANRNLYYYILVGELTATDGTSQRELTFQTGNLSTPENSYDKEEADSKFMSFEIADQRYLNQVEDDTAKGIITFLQGIKIGSWEGENTAHSFQLRYDETLDSVVLSRTDGKPAHFLATGALSTRGLGNTEEGGTGGGMDHVYNVDDFSKSLESFNRVSETDTFNAYAIRSLYEMVKNIENSSTDTSYVDGKIEDVNKKIDTNTAYLSEWIRRTEETLQGNIDAVESALQENIDTVAGDLSTLQTTVNDFLTGTDTDTIINRWKELEAFLNGYTETATLADLLSGKADRATTLAGYGITNAYTKTEVDSKITSVNTSVTTLQTTVSGHTTSINSLQNTVSGHTSSITSINSKITTLQGYFTDGVAKSALRLSDGAEYKAWGQVFFKDGKPVNVSGAATFTHITAESLTIGNTVFTVDGNTVYVTHKDDTEDSVTPINLLVTGALATRGLGDAEEGGGGSADLSSVPCDILPSVGGTYSIGSSSLSWKDGWFDSLHVSELLVGGKSIMDLLAGSDEFTALEKRVGINETSINNLSLRVTSNESSIADINSTLGRFGALAYKDSLAFSELTNKPTTLSGYGITDGVTLNSAQTISGTKTFSQDIVGNITGYSRFIRVNSTKNTNKTTLQICGGGQVAYGDEIDEWNSPYGNYTDSTELKIDYGTILRLRYSANYYHDIWFDANKSSIVYRKITNKVSAGWVTILDNLNFSTHLDSSYVKKSGDTMTGQLVLDSPTLGAANIVGNSSQGLILAKSSASSIRYIIADGNFRPNVTNKPSLGVADIRWSNVYSVLGNFSGQITSSVADGTAPFVVTSKTLVSNLNADMLDGKHLSEILASDITGNAATATYAQGSKNTGYIWHCTIQVGEWCRIMNMSTIHPALLQITFSGASQQSCYTFLIGSGHSSNGFISQIGATGYSANSSQKIRITRSPSVATIHYIEVYNPSVATTVRCRIIPLGSNSSAGWNDGYVYYTEYTPTTEDAIECASIECHYDGIVAKKFYGNIKLSTPVTLWGQSFDGSGNVSGNLTGVGTITGTAGVSINTTGLNGILLRYNSNDATSIALYSTAFRPLNEANGVFDLGSTSARWKGIYGQTLDLTGNATIGGNILPNSSGAGNVGTSSAKWLNGYINNIYTETVRAKTIYLDGTAKLTYDSTLNALLLTRDDGTVVHFLASGAVATRGLGELDESGGGSGTGVDLLNVPSDIIPSVGNTYSLGSSTNFWETIYANNGAFGSLNVYQNVVIANGYMKSLGNSWLINPDGSASFSSLTINGASAATQNWVNSQSFAKASDLNNYLQLNASTAQTVEGMVYFDQAYFNQKPFVNTEQGSSMVATMSDIPVVSFTQFLDSGVEIGRLDIGTQQYMLYAPSGSSVDLSNYVTLDGAQTITGSKTIYNVNVGSIRSIEFPNTAYIGFDSTVNLFGGLTIGTGDLKAPSIQSDNVLPKSNGSGNIGTSSLKWLNGYIDNLYSEVIYADTLTSRTSPYLSVTAASLDLMSCELYGYDSDNIDVWNVDFAGNAWFLSVTQTSDVRYKNIKENVHLKLADIAAVPTFKFSWANETDGSTHVGTSAQYWQEIAGELVVANKKTGKLGLDYSTAALVSAVSIAREVNTMKMWQTTTTDRIGELEERVKSLEEENKALRELLNNK